MRVLHLTPGTGSFHCGSCLRDNSLVKALRERGHDAMIAPLYLPMITDVDEANPEQPVRVGGIALYLQEKLPFFRYAPRWMHRWLNDEKRLRKAAKYIGMTSPRDLGVMTLGSLLGRKGKQWPEWQRLVEWVINDVKPEIVCLSNALLIGLAQAFAEAGIPVICSLQGEDAFLDTLIEPYRTKAWQLMVENSRYVTRYIAPSQFYADAMAPRLGVKPSDISIVYNGINADAYNDDYREPEVPTIGFLARMIHGKGLTTLVDAFLLLAARPSMTQVRLRVAGAQIPEDRPYMDGLQKKLASAGLTHRVTFEPNLTFEEKKKFLNEISVFSVPATYGEAFGIYVIEAQSCGIPVIQPRHGAFPELLETTQGGILCEPDDPASLADALEHVLLTPELRKQFSERGRLHARAHFSAARMAERFEGVLQSLQPVQEALVA